MEVIGKIKVINATVEVSASFKKRELVVETDEQYKQSILVEFHQDKCDILNSYKVGDDVKVSINLRGREWVNPQGETKYFNTIQGWKIDKTAVQEPQSAVDAYHANQPKLPNNTTATNEEADDLPF